MFRILFPPLALFLLACPLMLPASGADTAALKVGTTVENLNAAYNGESNANAKYLAFAAKADEEGYAGVASLFRAAAAAEKIHAQKHAKVIRAMGGTPECKIELPAIETTADNLKGAIAGESYERDTMYPGFLEKAKAEGAKPAVRSFNFALEAEAEHAKLYQEALNNLESWKTKKQFFVCSTCGYTTVALSFQECPTCSAGPEKFLKID